jgi:hypothetical protein
VTAMEADLAPEDAALVAAAEEVVTRHSDDASHTTAAAARPVTASSRTWPLRQRGLRYCSSTIPPLEAVLETRSSW